MPLRWSNGERSKLPSNRIICTTIRKCVISCVISARRKKAFFAAPAPTRLTIFCAPRGNRERASHSGEKFIRSSQGGKLFCRPISRRKTEERGGLGKTGDGRGVPLQFEKG